MLYILDEPSHRPAPAGQPPPARHPQAPARPGQHRAGGGARRGDHARRRLRGRPRARRGGAGRARGRGGHARRDRWRTPTSLTGRFLAGSERIRCRPRRREGQREVPRSSTIPREHNLKGMSVRIPLGTFTCDHRRVGLGQVHPGQRHPLPGAGLDAPPRAGPAGRPRPDRGRPASRQGHRHRPVADRAHAALQSRHLHRRVHADPHTVRAHARRAGARLPAGPLLVQRQGRALRGLPGRRPGQDRDALPARRVRDLRGLPAASATTARRWRCATRARTSPRSWT